MGFFSGLIGNNAIKKVAPHTTPGSIATTGYGGSASATWIPTAPALAPALAPAPAPTQVAQQTANTDLTLKTSPAISASTYTPANIAPHTNANQTLAANPARLAKTQVTNPNSLVSTQLNNVLDSNSPYLTGARTRAKQMGNRRGLLNSSMTAGAAEAAAINAALPIAQGDAIAYGRQSLTNQQYENQAESQNTQLGTQVSLNNASQANNIDQFNSKATDAINQLNTNSSNNAARFNAQQSNAIEQGNQNVQTKVDLSNQNVIANQRLQGKQSTDKIITSYMNAYTQIQTDASLNAGNKAIALKNIKTQMNNAQKAIAAVNTSLANLPTVQWV